MPFTYFNAAFAAFRSFSYAPRCAIFIKHMLLYIIDFFDEIGVDAARAGKHSDTRKMLLIWLIYAPLLCLQSSVRPTIITYIFPCRRSIAVAQYKMMRHRYYFPAFSSAIGFAAKTMISMGTWRQDHWAYDIAIVAAFFAISRARFARHD